MIGHSIFELESGNFDSKQTKLHQFRKEPSYDGDLPVNSEFDWTNRFRVKSPETKMLMDVGHINLIGKLVLRKPPYNRFKWREFDAGQLKVQIIEGQMKEVLLYLCHSR